MTLIRWNPVYDAELPAGGILSMQREINRLFDSFFRGGAQEDEGLFPCAWAPAVDLAEKEGDFVVKAELPGVDRSDVRITMQDNVLTIRGEKRQEKEESGKPNYRRVERSYGSFERSFALPAPVKSDGVEAAFKDGILTITLPKAEEARPRQIDVKVK